MPKDNKKNYYNDDDNDNKNKNNSAQSSLPG